MIAGVGARDGAQLVSIFFLCFCAFLWRLPTSQAQPPQDTAGQMAEIAAAWQTLRQETERLEIRDPQQAILVYKKFYEERGFRSLEVAIDVSSRIAQLYWLDVGNRDKAREIYDWAAAQYGALKGGERLVKERALLLGQAAPGQSVPAPVPGGQTGAGAPPVTMGLPKAPLPVEPGGPG
ncbi:MAG: hypothetical protein M3347_15985, partial [Armatimonadota bacterium]|nr:hypothetical protein [Armatimonadota bacterium]